MPTNEQYQVCRQTVESAAADAKPHLKRIDVTPDYFSRVALNAMMANPRIGECDAKSLRKALLTCAERGLMPDGHSAVIIPVRSKGSSAPKARLDVMIGGMLDKCREGIPGIVIRARCVYAADEFDYEDGLHPLLRHVPNKDGKRADENVIAAYAVAHIPGNEQPEFTVFYRAEIDDRRKRSPARNDGPWVTHYAQMAEKSVLRALLKRLPIRGQARAAIDDFLPESGEADTPAVEMASQGGGEYRARQQQNSDPEPGQAEDSASQEQDTAPDGTDNWEGDEF